MSDRYKGAILSPTAPTVTPQSAGGIYTSSQQLQYQGQGVWPTAANNPLTNSLRFRSSASAYLNRTPASNGNRQIMTFSAWVKYSTSNTYSVLFSALNSATTDQDAMYIDIASQQLVVRIDAMGGSNPTLTTTQVFRDPSAWYHIVMAIDTTQATASNRVKLYVNGNQITNFSGTNYPTQNLNLTCWNNGSRVQYIGTQAQSAPAYTWNGYITEVNFIDGQALTPSSFGTTDAYGIWQPIPYTGAYGTNGFYLPFTDNSALTTSSNVGLGKDFSGNGNYWVTNNISITAGSTYDSMKDVPTNTNSNTANYCVLNPLCLGRNVVPTLSEANLKATVGGTNGDAVVYGTMGVSSGKWYWEVTPTTIDATYESMGLTDTILPVPANISLTGANWLVYQVGGQFQNGTNPAITGSAYGNSFTSNDVIGIAFDADNGKLFFSKNGVFQNSGNPVTGTNPAASGLSGTKYPVQYFWAANSVRVTNFGQRPFSYTPPSGFYPLNTYNLPTPTILDGDQYMNASLWTGNGSTQSITNSGSMQPDFVWIKGRSTAWGHRLADAVRGVGKELFSNDTSAELTNNSGGYLTAFNSNGFSINSGAGVNTNNDTYVGWQWRASNAAGVSNTQGTITSTVSANTTAGFSIVTYTGTGSNATVGHGLGVAPSMIIVKSRTNAYDWVVYNSNIGNTKKLYLNLIDGSVTDSTAWNNTSPTSTVFSLGSNVGVNQSSSNYVAYCFAQIAGYSAFGSYTGNGSTNGPFVYTGFRPRWILFKRSDSISSWELVDAARATYNVVGGVLDPSSSAAETFSGDYGNICDFLSNGFKIRSTSSASNTGNVIYAAFAENPFKIARAR